MEMRDAVLETPWPEEPTPCVQMKASPLLWQTHTHTHPGVLSVSYSKRPSSGHKV